VCLVAGCVAVGSSRGLGLDLAETKGDGDAAKGSVDTGGHKGLLGSVIGLEIVALSNAEFERLDDLPFLLIESVSLVKEKARVFLVRGVLEVLLRGGVLSPIGTRSSTSLLERFSTLIVSSPSMIAPLRVDWSRARAVVHGGSEKPTYNCCC
jgi:hypothetical protein